MTKNEDIKNLKTEAKILAQVIEVETNKFSESISKHKKSLERELTKLKELNVMLQSVPKKLEEQIKNTIPEIAKELDAINTKKVEQLDNLNEERIEEIRYAYQSAIQKQSESLWQTEEKIRSLTETLGRFSRKRILQFFIGIIISSAISVGCAIYAASYMIQTFPTRVTIDKPENIILYDSEVGLWGTDNVKVLKGLRKNNRKNANKY